MVAMSKTFEDLGVWQRSHSIVFFSGRGALLSYTG